MSYVFAFIGFSLLIVLHEAGHFFAARKVGMRVERFFLFLPPKLISFKRGETEYGIGMIPLGGFVKITGMNPDEVHPPAEGESGQASRLTVFMEGDAAGGTPDVEPLPPELVARAYYNQPVWKRIVVIAAGPVVNIVIAFFIFFGLGLTASETVGPGLKITNVASKSPAAGQLRKDDVMVSVDGVTGAPGWAADDRAQVYSDLISSHLCAGSPVSGCSATTPATIVVDRDGKRVVVKAAPKYQPDPDGTGESPGRTLIGFQQEALHRVSAHHSVPKAAGDAVHDMWLVTSRTATVFGKIFSAKQRKQLSGVVGTYDATQQAFSLDLSDALLILGLISLSLGIINLLPLLPLDGGHIFWSIVEKVRGKAVPFYVMERASMLGILLVLVLFFIGLSNDVGRLTSGHGFVK